MNKSKKARTTLLSRSPSSTIINVVAATIIVSALGACAPRVDTRGNQVHPEDIAAIQPGQTTRNHVLDRLGSPASQGNVGAETWNYISERTETNAFLAPEIKERSILVLEFDEAGVVKTVNTVDETNGEVVEPAPGKTPTAGNSVNFIQQILSNLGRFNKK